jgi:uncharacterized membrane protein
MVGQIHELPEAMQFLVVCVTFAALASAAALIIRLFGAGAQAFPKAFAIVGQLGPLLRPLLGLAFILVGSQHFHPPSRARALAAIVPPRGTWGVWWVPGNAMLHVQWTGVVEVCGGLGLAVGRWLAPAVTRRSARALFLLTLLVTPANIYMLTHDAPLPGVAEEPLHWGVHLARMAAQAALLAALFALAEYDGPEFLAAAPQPKPAIKPGHLGAGPTASSPRTPRALGTRGGRRRPN